MNSNMLIVQGTTREHRPLLVSVWGYGASSPPPLYERVRSRSWDYQVDWLDWAAHQLGIPKPLEPRTTALTKRDFVIRYINYYVPYRFFLFPAPTGTEHYVFPSLLGSLIKPDAFSLSVRLSGPPHSIAQDLRICFPHFPPNSIDAHTASIGNR